MNKTNLRAICLFTARAVDSEWTHMRPATSVNNDDGTDYLRLRVHDQTIVTRSIDPRDYHPDASGSWLPVVLNRWYDNTKKKPWVGCLQLTCHCLHIVRNGLRSPSLSLTRQLAFNTLCLNRWFGKKGQPVSSLFHIQTGFAHNSGHAGGLRGFSTDRETAYRNCLPLCTMGRKTWRHGDPHPQNYDVCGDDLARINMIYHFYAPG